jgi:plasmid stabilization system protein ParE
MAKKSIIWTETEAKQRRLVLEYWNENNGSTTYSEKLIIEIKNRLDTIASFPKSGRKTDFLKTFVSSLGHYSIFYQILKSKILITGFWDNRQDPKSLIDLLK